jgi:hypothetical protein
MSVSISNSSSAVLSENISRTRYDTMTALQDTLRCELLLKKFARNMRPVKDLQKINID